MKTGVINPRDYGIVIGSAFLSPARFALAHVFLEKPSFIRKRIGFKARSMNEDPSKLEKLLAEGVKRKDGTKNFLNHHHNTAVKNVQPYKSQLRGQVKSRQITRPAYHHTSVTIQGNSITGSDCRCKDDFWNDIKKYNVVCMHAASIIEALRIDNLTKLSSKKNIMGLPPRKRPEVTLPFEFSQTTITDVLFDYYVNGEKLFDINKKILDSSLSAQFRDFVVKGHATIHVLRHNEENITPKTVDEKIYHGNVVALQKRIVDTLREKGFLFTGYSLEFANTPYEIIGKRFRKNENVYVVCTGNDLPPFTIHKVFQDQSPYYLTPEKIDINPYNTTSFQSVDDTTRKIAANRIIIPADIQPSLLYKYNELSTKSI